MKRPPRKSTPPLQAAYRRLFEAYGPQEWWPARDRLEIMVGAVLVQHTSWKNVERAVRALHGAAALSLTALAEINENDLAELIRPAGTARVKARRIKALVEFVAERSGGSLDRFFSATQSREGALALRKELLEVHGVGPETADAILLYAGGAPVFVVDAYARRILGRHGWGDATASYDTVQNLFETVLPRDAQMFNEYHALIVRVGKEHCRSREPICEGCPLSPLLPRGGPRLV